ncbi:alpha/beta hydrolases superfamily protein [Tanacetum coccineum]
MLTYEGPNCIFELVLVLEERSSLYLIGLACTLFLILALCIMKKVVSAATDDGNGPRGHGEDNSPPNDDHPWEPPYIHKNAKGRKKGPNAKLDKKFEDGHKKNLPIIFDLNDQKTAKPVGPKPVGPNCRDFTGLIRNEIEQSIPLCYESWEAVPEKYKGTLWPVIHSLSEWHELCDHFTSEKHLARSEKSKANRAKLPQSSTQGSRSYAASRYEEWEITGVFPDLIEHYKKSHQKSGKCSNRKCLFAPLYEHDTMILKTKCYYYLTTPYPTASAVCSSSSSLPDKGVFPDLIEHFKKSHQKNEKWDKEIYKTRYMLKLRASQEGLAVRMTDDKIMDKVLGRSRTFKPGRGRKLRNSASSSSVRSYPAPPPSTSQAALRSFMEAHNDQMKDMHSQLADKNIEL